MDWLSYVSLATGAVGTILGVRAELWRWKEYSVRQEDRANLEAEKQRDCVMASRNILAAARAIPLKDVADLVDKDRVRVQAAISRLVKLIETESPKIARVSVHLLPALYELPHQCEQILQYLSAEVVPLEEVPRELVYTLYKFWQHLWEISLLPVLAGAKGGSVGSLAAVERDEEVADLAARQNEYHKYYQKSFFGSAKVIL